MSSHNNENITKATELLRTNSDLMSLKNTDIENILSSVFGTKPEEKAETTVCPSCGKNEFIEDHKNGIIVCKCGQIMDEIYDTNMDRRQHDADEGDNVRNNILYNKLLPQSSLGTILPVGGKLKKMHIWNSMQYKDRSLIAIYKFVHTVCQELAVVKQIEDDAKIICYYVSRKCHPSGKNIGKPIITRGDNRTGIVGATVFIACRRNGDTRSVKEIAAACKKITERDVNKGLKSLLNILLDDDIIKDTGTSKVTDFIMRKCDELEIRKIYTQHAVNIADNIGKLNIASNHTTYSLAAASILLMAEMHGLHSITRKRLSEVFGVSDVTIGKSYTQIEKYKDILTNNQKTEEIVTKMKQKDLRQIPLVVWMKMKEFNVDTSKYLEPVEVNNN